MPEAQAASFWGAVAQIVPVFALTLVLELRRAASRWSLNGKIQRRFESLTLLTAGAFLYWLFLDALQALHGKSAMQPANATILLTLVLFLLAVNPLWLGTMSAHADLLDKAAAWRTRVRCRRRIRFIMETLEGQRAAVDRLLTATDLLVNDARARLSDAGSERAQAFLEPANLARIQTVTINTRRSASSSDLASDMLVQLIERYRHEPSTDLALRLFRVHVWVLLEYRSQLRSLASGIRDQRAEVESLRRHGARYGSDAERLAHIERTIANAGQDFLAVWSEPMPTEGRSAAS